ncbi:MAG: sigma factor-like helix-turn-helix DNA-binding protein [Anaerohalosphaeraceae bacterium]
MTDEHAQLDTANCSNAELIAWFLKAFPALQEAYLRLCTFKSMSCGTCPIKVECIEFNKTKADITCLLLEPLLPGRYAGAGYREKTVGSRIEIFEALDKNQTKNTGDDNTNFPVKLDESTLRSIKKTRIDDVFSLYKNCPPDIFTLEQWEAVCLRFEYSLKQEDIAKRLNIKRSTVGDRLRRAKKNMENYYKRNNSYTSNHVQSRHYLQDTEDND